MLLCSACALPVVSAGTFLPAGDLESGDVHASISLETGRVLAGPSDIHDLPATPAEAEQYEVSTWVASDVSLRWQVAPRITLEGQIKLTNPVVPFTPTLAGGAVGVRVRLRQRPPEGGVSLEIGARVVAPLAVGLPLSAHASRGVVAVVLLHHWIEIPVDRIGWHRRVAEARDLQSGLMCEILERCIE